MWEVLIPSSNVNTTPELRIFVLTSFLRFFRRFPKINVGGDSTHLSSFGKRTREPRLARPQKGMLRQCPCYFQFHFPSQSTHGSLWKWPFLGFNVGYVYWWILGVWWLSGSAKALILDLKLSHFPFFLLKFASWFIDVREAHLFLILDVLKC